MNDFDGVLKELGELYEFNREIRSFVFLKKTPYGAIEPNALVAEDTPEYKTGND
ncbi:MAG: hypothetical protein KAU94_06695 [Verrucomicrobia bacterium]|nr:hypothetical protein [Verrucomicrobiota bacterium]